MRGACTSDPKGRQVEVWPHTPAVQAMRARLRERAAQACLSRRQEIIEPRFGQIKQHEGFRRWTAWGLEAVRTQWALLCTTLNLRVIYRHWRAGRAGGGGPDGKVLKVGGGIFERSCEWTRVPGAMIAAGLFSPVLSALRPKKYF